MTCVVAQEALSTEFVKFRQEATQMRSDVSVREGEVNTLQSQVRSLRR